MSEYTTETFNWYPTPTAEYPFYVYELVRPDGTVFYVGKGTGNRISQHGYEARSGHQCHKCNVIRKVWSEGEDVIGRIVHVTNNEIEAYRFEARTIAYYGLENLTNVCAFDEHVGTPQILKRAPRPSREVKRRQLIEFARGMFPYLKHLKRCARSRRDFEYIDFIERQEDMYRDVLLPLSQLNFLDIL